MLKFITKIIDLFSKIVDIFTTKIVDPFLQVDFFQKRRTTLPIDPMHTKA